jgi:hypothetical protein
MPLKWNLLTEPDYCPELFILSKLRIYGESPSSGVFLPQFFKLLRGIDSHQYAGRFYGDFHDSGWISANHDIRPLRMRQGKDFFQNLAGEQNRMPAAPFERRKDNAIGGKIHDHCLDGRRLHQRMVHKEEKRACRVPREGADARLKGRDHTLLVNGVENGGGQPETSLYLLTVMAEDDNGVLDGSAGNRVENIFEERSAAEREKGLRSAHSLGFTSCEDNRRYQCFSPDLLRLDRRTEIQIP